jgi:hypothetical protein
MEQKLIKILSSLGVQGSGKRRTKRREVAIEAERLLSVSFSVGTVV